MTDTGWDIIGDVHGRADALRALLGRLGYAERDGVVRHPWRRALFIGDLVDRGPDVGGVLRLARAMVESGAARAILGNHEYNVLCHRHDALHRTPVERARCRMNPQKEREMAPTLEALDAEPGLEGWLVGLPIWLEFDGARFAHAYWGAREMAALEWRRTPRECGWDEESFPRTPLGRAVDRVLKGPEISLPSDVIHVDRHGTSRRDARVAWWKPCPEGALLNDVLVARSDAVEGRRATADQLASYDVYPPEAPPVFIGHYGFDRPPGLLAANVACVDFGDGSGGDGAIGAYRWDGACHLGQEHLVRS